MDPVELTLKAITSVYDVIKENSEVYEEVKELKDVVELLQTAIKPLQKARSQRVEDYHAIFDRMQELLSDASETCAVLEQKRGSWLWRPRKELDKIKEHRDKLSSLVPMLNLAVTACVAQKRQSKVQCLDLIEQEEAKQFWSHHFGDCEFVVEWEEFAASIGPVLKPAAVTLHDLMLTIDPSQPKHVDASLFNRITMSHKKLVDSVAHFVTSQQKKRAAEEEEEEALQNRSLKKVKTEPVSRTTSSTSASSFTHLVLTLFGSPSLCQLEAAKPLRQLKYSWRDDNTITIGRDMFLKMPKHCAARVSRIHCKLQCIASANQEEDEHDVWLHDCSGNGILVNDSLVGRGNKILLTDGDRITLLRYKADASDEEETLLGYDLSFRS